VTGLVATTQPVSPSHQRVTPGTGAAHLYRPSLLANPNWDFNTLLIDSSDYGPGPGGSPS